MLQKTTNGADTVVIDTPAKVQEDENFKKVWDSLGKKKSRLGFVKLSTISIDQRFQRHLDPHSVTHITDNFHPAGVGIGLICSIKGEEGWKSIDGQTRMHVLNGFYPNYELRCEIYENLTVPEAVLLFELRNYHKAVKPKERDRISVNRGDKTMTEVMRQVEATDYVIFSDDPALVTMPYLEEAKRLIRHGGRKKVPNLLTRSLLIQDMAFRRADGNLNGTVHDKLLQACGYLIARNPKLVDEDLAEVMSGIGLPVLNDEIQKRVGQDGRRFTVHARLLLTGKYNKRKAKADQIVSGAKISA